MYIDVIWIIVLFDDIPPDMFGNLETWNHFIFIEDKKAKDVVLFTGKINNLLVRDDFPLVKINLEVVYFNNVLFNSMKTSTSFA